MPNSKHILDNSTVDTMFRLLGNGISSVFVFSNFVFKMSFKKLILKKSLLLRVFLD